MYVTYQVNTLIMADAMKTAINLAKASGYKRVTVSKAIQTGAGTWDVVLVVS
jgi:hypothetical protein